MREAAGLAAHASSFRTPGSYWAVQMRAWQQLLLQAWRRSAVARRICTCCQPQQQAGWCWCGNGHPTSAPRRTCGSLLGGHGRQALQVVSKVIIYWHTPATTVRGMQGAQNRGRGLRIVRSPARI